MNDQPLGWAIINLGEVVTVSSGIAFPVEYQGVASGELPFFKVADISFAVRHTQGYLLKANHHVSRNIAAHLRGKPIAVGSTAFAKIGEAVRLNRRAMVAVHCLIDNNVMAVKAHYDSMDRYVYHFLRTVDFSQTVRSTTVPSLRKGDIESLAFPLAPQAEQQRIADKLDTVLARVDACRDRLARVAPLLKRFRQSVLAAATSGRLTADWRNSSPSCPRPKQITLKELCYSERVITYGVIKLGDETRTGVPCLRTSNVRWLRFELEGLKRISPSLSAEYGRTVLHGGEVLVNVRGTLGGVAVVDASMVGWNVSREVAVVPVDVTIADPKFVALYLASDEAQKWLSGVERGVAYIGINIEDLRNLPLIVPAKDEQAEAVRRVEILFTYADRIEARMAQAQAATDRLTPALLAKAFRGELVPQDPNDEPASELLRRLMANRRELTKKERPRRARAGRASK
jgi:type I restriction enzyme, S subunit